jgi:hypothetical protein
MWPSLQSWGFPRRVFPPNFADCILFHRTPQSKAERPQMNDNCAVNLVPSQRSTHTFLPHLHPAPVVPPKPQHHIPATHTSARCSYASLRLPHSRRPSRALGFIAARRANAPLGSSPPPGELDARPETLNPNPCNRALLLEPVTNYTRPKP